MNPVAAVCLTHGPFEASGFSLMGVRSATFNRTRHSCPICGKLSRVMEGEYSIDHDGVATPINAPEWSRQALAVVQAALNKAADRLKEEATPEQEITKEVLKELRLLRIERAEDRVRHSKEKSELNAKLKVLEEALKEIPKIKTRSRAAKIMRGLFYAAQIFATAVGTIAGVINLAEWAGELLEKGIDPALVVPPLDPVSDESVLRPLKDD